MKALAGAPLPPADLSTKALPLDILPKGTQLHRIHDGVYGPVFYDYSGRGRFNAPDSSFGSLYCAFRRDGAFAETLLREVGNTTVSEAFVLSRAHASLELNQDARLVRMYGSGLHLLGATATIASIESYDIPQTWSKSLFEHPDKPDGIVYRSRHDDDEKCVVLFDRIVPLVNAVGAETNLLSEPWFYDLLDKYGAGLAPTAI